MNHLDLVGNAAARPKRRKGNPPLAQTGAKNFAWSKRTRFNPIRQLDPSQLARILDDFESGNLREAAMLFETIVQRDELLASVKPKRELAIAQLPWEVVMLNDSPEALRHKAALEFFWNHCTATSVYERNLKGGFSRIVRQMMEAVSYRYSTHHIVMQPLGERIEVEGGGTLDGLTATFEHVPLYFFENRDGILRYLENGFGVQGVDLEEGEWLTTVGDGVMIACACCYMFKRMSVQDWVMFCEKFGIPGVHAETSAPFGGAEWDAVAEAAAKFMNDWGCVTAAGTKFNLLQASGGSGSLPMPPLVERMDRMMAALYRGADLSTMSAGAGSGEGASLQGDESELIELADAAMITESLNQVDRLVLAWHFGSARSLAYTKLICEPQQDTKLQIEIDKFLIGAGAPIAVADTLERYGRTLPDEGEPLLTRVASPSAGNGRAGIVSCASCGQEFDYAARPETSMGAVACPGCGAKLNQEGRVVGNAQPLAEDSELLRTALARAVRATPRTLAPIAHLLRDLQAKAADGISDEELLNFVEKAAMHMPELFGHMDVAALADELEAATGTAVINGVTKAFRRHPQLARSA